MMMTISGKRPLGMAKDTTMTKTNRRLWSSASHRNIYNRIDNEIHSTHYTFQMYIVSYPMINIKFFAKMKIGSVKITLGESQ